MVVQRENLAGQPRQALRSCFKNVTSAGRASRRRPDKTVRNDFEQPQAGLEGASPMDGASNAECT
jgi:hypothetical protein